MKRINNKGISLVEIMIALSVIAIITAIVLPSFSLFKKQQALRVTTEDIISLLNEARNMTISSKNSINYGVRLQNDKAILFRGPSFTDYYDNKQIDFDSSVIIPNSGGINLSGGGSDVIFKRITGDTLNSGTIIVQLVGDSSKQKVININSLGVISSN